MTRAGASAAWGDADARRRDILRAARELVAEGGAAMLHMRTIGARAGVSPGTVYLYFAGKEGVLAALLLEDLEHAIETLDNSSGGLQEVLTSIVPDLIRLWRVGSSDVVRQFGVRAEEPPTEPDPLPQEKTVAVGVAAIERALIRAPKGPVRRKAH